jgi:Zn ribbon nucleic-acid-binding protein
MKKKVISLCHCPRCLTEVVLKVPKKDPSPVAYCPKCGWYKTL